MKSRRLVRYTWFLLFYNLVVILWGAYVRATGSGAGCGNHWPLCDSEIISRAPAIDTLIEYTHRLSSGLAFLSLDRSDFAGRLDFCDRGLG